MEVETAFLPSQRPFHTELPMDLLDDGPNGNTYTNLSRSNSPIDSPPEPNDASSMKMLKADTKICGVCGDKALGNNFNAITCESCKAFFRRNALKQKSFVCPFNDNCKVDPVTRRFCQKCRLKKCFEIGMKKEWIMTDEEKKLKKRKIEQNKVKRQGSENTDAPPIKTVCLGSPESRAEGFPNTPLSKRGSPLHESQGLQALGIVQPPNGGSGADSTTTFDSVSDDQISILQSSDVTCSPASNSSNSNSSSDLGYTMSPLVMSQFLGSPSVPSPCANQGGQGSTTHMMSSTFPQQSTGMNTRTVGAEFQGFHWAEDGNVQPEQQRPYPVSPPYILPHPIKADLSSNQGHVGGQPLKVTDYLVAQLQPRQPKPKISAPYTSSSSNQYQSPLLTSLIRPGDPGSPPDENNAAIGNQFERSHGYGGASFAHTQQSVSHLNESPPGSVGNGGLDVKVNHGYVAAPNQYTAVPNTEDEIPPPLPLNTMDSIVSVAIRAEFNSFGLMCKSQEPFSKELNGAEVAKLQELVMACEALGDPVDQEGPLKLSKHSDPTLINVINLTDIAIRRLIKMSKKISGFKNMCQEDQIALLKGGCTEMMILRSVVTYDPDRDSWNIPHSYGYNIKLGVLKEARGNLYEEHQRFVKSFKPEWRTDEKIMILLCAITLFTAERPNVIHKDVVKLEQDSYYYLLKRYLESMLNGCEARSTYLLLIRKIAELRILNSTHLRVFLEVNPREVEPLLREVFSMV